ncbi:MAG: DNA-primase RepB domain-containing protein, partial [Pyrinomonadaceae bacterium]
ELIDVFHALKRRRMVETFGQCRRSDNERLAYLDTHDTSDGRRDGGGGGVPPRSSRKRQTHLRKVGAEMIARGERQEWLRILRRRVAETQEFRRTRLAEIFPHATFSTLDGHIWYGNVLLENILQGPDCVNLFAHVGVKEFAVTMLRDRSTIGRRGELYQRLEARQLMRSLPTFIKRNRMVDESVIIRPIGDHLIQVDDCNSELLDRLKPFAFLAIETSPENYQSWLALPIGTEKSDRDSIRSRLLRCLEGVDRSASGAMRWPGSLNHKPGRNGFCVRIVASIPGRFVTPANLASAGLLDLEITQAVTESQLVDQRVLSGPFSWPDYARCLREAPLKKDGSPDRSIADKNWCILALDRGWADIEVESRLCELSDKARRPSDYAKRTVAYAASVISQNDGPSAMFAAILQQLRSGNHESATA